MSILDFTAEGTNFIAIYRHVTRENTAAHISDVLQYMDGDMRPIAESAGRDNAYFVQKSFFIRIFHKTEW